MHARSSEEAQFFNWFASKTSTAAGQPLTFAIAVAIIVVWSVTGPKFHYSDTWQLIINSGTTNVTFVMIFLMLNSQSRDGPAMQAAAAGCGQGARAVLRHRAFDRSADRARPRRARETRQGAQRKAEEKKTIQDTVERLLDLF